MLKKLNSIALWKQIVVAIVLGAAYGLLLPQAVPYITFLGDIFLRLLKMLIAPLVLFTLVSGVCKMGDVRQLRTVGVRIVVYYLISSAIAAAIGMGVALISQPGRGVTDLLGSEAGEAVSYNFLENLISWVPTNIFEALTTGNTLQILHFAGRCAAVYWRLCGTVDPCRSSGGGCNGENDRLDYENFSTRYFFPHRPDDDQYQQ